MLVCHCHRVNDAQVLDAGASTLAKVARATKAGTGCGGCLPALRALCDEVKQRRCAVHDDEALAG